MEAFENPIFQNIDSPQISPNKEILNIKDNDNLLETLHLSSQISDDLMRFQGLEKQILTAPSEKDQKVIYEDLKLEVLELKNHLLNFQAKFERQKSINSQNIHLIELLKKDLSQKSTEIQKLSLENSENFGNLTTFKQSESVKPEMKRFSTKLSDINDIKEKDPELLKRIKALEIREKTLIADLLKSYEAKSMAEEKVRELEEEIKNINADFHAKNQEKNVFYDKIKALELEKKALSKEINDLKSSQIKLEESLLNERDQTKKKEIFIEKISQEKAKILKDMQKSYEEHNQFIQQIELENQTHLLLLRQFQEKEKAFENTIAELNADSQAKAQTIKSLAQKNEDLTNENQKLESFKQDIDTQKNHSLEIEALCNETKKTIQFLETKLKSQENDFIVKENSWKKEKQELLLKVEKFENLYKSQIEHCSLISKNVEALSSELCTAKAKNIQLLSLCKELEDKTLQLQCAFDSISEERKKFHEKEYSEILKEKEKEKKEIQNKKENNTNIEKNDQENELDNQIKIENFRLLNQLKEKHSLVELLEKRLENNSKENHDLQARIEVLEGQIWSLKQTNMEMQGLMKGNTLNYEELQKKLEVSQKKNFTLLEDNKSLSQEVDKLIKENKEIESRNSLLSQTYHLNISQNEEIEKLKSELAQKEKESIQIQSELHEKEETLISHSFSIKTLQQSIHSYRESLSQSESQIKSLETEKLVLESQIRLLKQEKQAFEEDKARLRDVLFFANQSKDRLLNELEIKDQLLQQLKSSSNEKKEKPNTDENKPKNIKSGLPQNKINQTKLIELTLIDENQEQFLYNKVLKLSQKAIDILKKYEMLVNAYHKAKKPIKSNLKEVMKPEIQKFLEDFVAVISKFTGREISPKLFIAKRKILVKTNGSQEDEINETLMNCRTFIIDFVTKEGVEELSKYDLREKKLYSTRIQKKTTIIDKKIIQAEVEEIFLENTQEEENLNYSQNKENFEEILKKIQEKIQKNQDFKPFMEKILGKLKKISEEKEKNERLLDLKELLAFIENENSTKVLPLWLFIKRMQNLLDFQELLKEDSFILSNIDSETD